MIANLSVLKYTCNKAPRQECTTKQPMKWHLCGLVLRSIIVLVLPRTFSTRSVSLERDWLF